jgi:hypothetical protein
MKWWSQSANFSDDTSSFSPFPSMQAPGITLDSFEMTFPPRP